MFLTEKDFVVRAGCNPFQPLTDSFLAYPVPSGASVSSPVNAEIPTLKGAILRITHTPILEVYDVEQALHVDAFAFPACLSYDDGYFFRKQSNHSEGQCKMGISPWPATCFLLM